MSLLQKGENYLQGTSFILFHRVVKLYLILDVGYLGGLLSHHITAFSSSSSVSLLESEFLGCPEENPPSISDSAGDKEERKGAAAGRFEASGTFIVGGR